ncbi:hypothetical protein [Capnocytophaga felis]|uniref:Gliding motility protein n=1 Tax=Capnocytophaga felis TaxID=2267611 RepID=A0A5M4B9I9_9FLAO|nr:hypothetical protein [Capnocytophaga felis]GET46060.1 hypothetical protein RCZ01_13620 [Capnocytophaga felis]GET48852.1 hypothetical protein RCZ02_16830 [Capnocytophaga felis]
MSELLFSVGDVFKIWLERFNLFFPCQILEKNEDKGLLVLVFNNFQSEIPKIENIKNWQPLYNDHHYWKKEFFCGWISDFEQLNPVFLGNVPTTSIPAEKEIDKWTVHNTQQIESQYLWQQLDTEIQKNFKAQKYSKIWIKEPPTNNFFKDLAEKHRYSYEIESDFFSSELIDYLEITPMIICLNLPQKQNLKVVDISKTHLRDLHLNISNVEKLILNPLLVDLVLTGDFSTLKTIECPFGGKLLDLQLNLENSQFHFSGLEQVKKVRIFSNQKNAVDGQNIIECLPQVEDMLINGQNATLHNVLSFKELKNIKSLWITNAYGFNDFPQPVDFPLLEKLWVWSIPKTVGDKIKKEFSKLPDFEAKQLRSESWLKANLGNPFSAWDGRDGTSATIAKKAMAAYTNFYKKLDKKDLKPEEKEALLIDFIQIFNQIDKKHSIDTLEREEIWEAFTQLAQLTPLNDKEIETIFENHRDF